MQGDIKIDSKSKAFTKERKSILFLHGYLADKRSFAYQIPFFMRDFDVFAPDMKGFGENQGMDYPYSLDDYVKEVINYIKDNKLNKPHVIAHSFGARVAIKAAAQDAELFDKIVLTGAAGLKPRRTLKKTFKKITFKVLARFISKDRLQNFYSSDYRALSPIMKESFKKIVSEHLDDELEKIKNKTLIVFGDKDKDTPLYMARRLNVGIKNSKLIIIRGAGHFCFIDHRAKFNREVKEFLLS